MKLAVSLILAGMAALSALVASPAHAQIQLSEADPPDLGVLETPAEVAGTLRFQVLTESGAASALNPFTPPARIPAPGETPPAETPTAATPSPGETPSTETTPAAGGPDILLTALLTVAVAGGAAVVATLGYFLRRAIGFDPHRPPDGDEGGSAGH